MKAKVPSADQADSLLADGLCAYEDYLNEHQRACEKLKQVLSLDVPVWITGGFLKLTMARRHLPAHALSDLSYHERFEAVTVVAACALTEHAADTDGDDNDAARWTLTSPNSDESVKVNTKDTTKISSLTQRKGKIDTQATEGDSVKHPQQQDLQNSTIMWFSSLPPNDLRQAQKNFRSALQALLYAATSAAKVQHAVNAVQKP